MRSGLFKLTVSCRINDFHWSFINVQFLIAALSGILFPGKEEAAYSNFRLWESTGSVITYAYSPYLCTHIKLYLLLGLLLIGISGYTGIEMLKSKKQDEEEDTSKGEFTLVKNRAKSGEVAEWLTVILGRMKDTEETG